MLSELKPIRQATKALHRFPDKQAKSITRVERLRGKLEKASRKMRTLEARTAQLEQRVHGLRNPGGQPLAQYAKGFRPARLIINPNGGSYARQVESPEKLVALLGRPNGSAQGSTAGVPATLMAGPWGKRLVIAFGLFWGAAGVGQLGVVAPGLILFGIYSALCAKWIQTGARRSSPAWLSATA